jgi:hypothetical protein
MKRARRAAPGLKHLAFFEVLGATDEHSPSARAATAGLLALRLVDHWMLAGATMVEPESVSIRSVRQAIMMIPANDPQREVLLGLINTMQTLREVDLSPVLPRLFAYAGLLEKRGILTLAADVYMTVIRLADDEYDADVVVDSHMRLAFCRRLLGALTEAEEAYTEAGVLAKRLKEPARVLHARIGIAKVAMERGNLPAADRTLEEVAAECATLGFEQVQAMALHDRAGVAIMRGNHTLAVCLAYEALEHTAAASERERVLNDIAVSFIALGRYDEARTALLIQEATATTNEMTCLARVNLLSLAAREGNEDLFASYDEMLAGVPLPPQITVNYLIERARGVRRFKSAADAEWLLTEAREIAATHGLNKLVFEADQMMLSNVEPVRTTSGGTSAVEPDPAAYVSAGLRRMLASVGG